MPRDAQPPFIALLADAPTLKPLHGSDGFAKRCARELGYQPGTILRRLSAFDLELTPAIDSLQIDAMDPLDP